MIAFFYRDRSIRQGGSNVMPALAMHRVISHLFPCRGVAERFKAAAFKTVDAHSPHFPSPVPSRWVAIPVAIRTVNRPSGGDSDGEEIEG
jgi:hypothetical protein